MPAPIPELLIRNWPLVDEWRTRCVVVGLTIGVFFFAAWQSQSWAMAAAASFALSLAMWSFWLPVHFHFQARGIERRCCGRGQLIPWRVVKDYHLRRSGVVLRCRFDDSRLIRQQWLFVQWHDQQREVLEAIEIYGPTPQNSPSDTNRD